MTQEEKQLLFKDLCGRLPYGVMIQRDNCFGGKVTEKLNAHGLAYDETYGTFDSLNYKPYLRPMSSMTEEELNECVRQSGIKDIECPNWQDIPKEEQFEARLNFSIAVLLTDSNNIDWLNAHHFDFRGLIEKGLALEATENMYKEN